MPRISRLVVPGVAHHVTQRGNRRQVTFFGAWDYHLYKCLLAHACERWGVAIGAYCLMPNHVHLILIPADERGLARALGATHQAYSTAINRREGWKGFLWQGRFASYPMSPAHRAAALRYLLLNPVRAGLVHSAADWAHSSLRAHQSGGGDGVVDPAALAAFVPDWSTFLGTESTWSEANLVRRHLSTGLPLGNESFVSELELRTGTLLRPPFHGREPAAPATARD